MRRASREQRTAAALRENPPLLPAASMTCVKATAITMRGMTHRRSTANTVDSPAGNSKRYSDLPRGLRNMTLRKILCHTSMTTCVLAASSRPSTVSGYAIRLPLRGQLPSGYCRRASHLFCNRGYRVVAATLRTHNRWRREAVEKLSVPSDGRGNAVFYDAMDVSSSTTSRVRSGSPFPWWCSRGQRRARGDQLGAGEWLQA